MNYMISFALPRFTDQTLSRSRKRALYPAGTPDWVAKLDTVVHELYHIDPEQNCLRRFTRADGDVLRRAAQPDLLRRRGGAGAAVSRDRIPIPRCSSSSSTTSTGLRARYGGVGRRRRSARSRRIRAAIASRSTGQPLPAELRNAPRREGRRRRRPRRSSRRGSAAARVHRERVALIEPDRRCASVSRGLRLAAWHVRPSVHPLRPTNRLDQYCALRLDAHDAARAGRVDELIAAHGDPDV